MTMRKSMSKRFEGAFKGIKKIPRPKGFTLPKVSRARGSFTLLNRPRFGIGRKKADRSKGKESTLTSLRQPAPEVSKELAELLTSEDGEFVLWLGPDFAKALQPGDPAHVAKTGYAGNFDLAQILDGLKKEVKDEEQLQEISNILDGVIGKSEEEIDPNEKTKAVFTAQSKFLEALGPQAFNRLLSSALNEEFNKIYEKDGALDVDDLPFKLIKALRPKCVVYTGTDRLLEKQFAHDNIPVKSMTVLDMQASSFNVESLSESKQNQQSPQVVLKLHGDVNQPETIQFQKEDLFAQYGLGLDGKKLEGVDEEITIGAMYLRSFLKELLEKYPVVFIGNELRKDEPIVHLMAEFQSEKPKAAQEEKTEPEKKEEAEAKSETKQVKDEKVPEDPPVPQKHFALVTKVEDEKELKRFSAEEVDINYELYKPDLTHSQIIEFLASMTTLACSAIPEDIVQSSIFVKGFVASLAYDKYLIGMTRQEEKARALCFFANELAGCTFVSEESFTEDMLKPEIGQRINNSKNVEDLMAKVLEALVNREKMFFDKLTSEEKAEGTIVKLLLPKRAIADELGLSKAEDDKKDEESSEKDVNEIMLKKYEKLLELAEASNGSLEVRLIEFENESEDKLVTVATDFSLLFLGANGVGDVALLKESSRKDFHMGWIDVNTNETEDKVLLFERMWNVAVSNSKSLEFIKKTIEEIKTGATTTKTEAAEKGEKAVKTTASAKPKRARVVKNEKPAEKAEGKPQEVSAKTDKATEEKPAKPRRTRRTRGKNAPKPKAEEPAKDEKTETKPAAEGKPQEASAKTDKAAEVKPGEEKPSKPRRTRRTRGKNAPKPKAEEPAKDEKAETKPAAEGKPQEVSAKTDKATEEKPAKPRRTRRTRGKNAPKPKAEEAAKDEKTETKPVAEKPAASNQPKTTASRKGRRSRKPAATTKPAEKSDDKAEKPTGAAKTSNKPAAETAKAATTPKPASGSKRTRTQKAQGGGARANKTARPAATASKTTKPGETKPARAAKPAAKPTQEAAKSTKPAADKTEDKPEKATAAKATDKPVEAVKETEGKGEDTGSDQADAGEKASEVKKPEKKGGRRLPRFFGRKGEKAVKKEEEEKEEEVAETAEKKEVEAEDK